jgi:hypothetical protein
MLTLTDYPEDAGRLASHPEGERKQPFRLMTRRAIFLPIENRNEVMG